MTALPFILGLALLGPGLCPSAGAGSGSGGVRAAPDPAPAAGGPPTLAAPGHPGLAGLLAPIRETNDLPALAGAVVTSRGLEALAAVGVRKRGTLVAVTTNDLWHLGSDTKAMTAALAGRWVERGRLRWDSTTAGVFPELAPEFAPDCRGITLQQLLSHRAGLRANLRWSALSHGGTVTEQRLRAVVEGLGRPPESPPGTQTLYSNLGYVIAGAMIERVSGVSWEDGLRRDILDPLGMTRAGFGGPGTPGELDQPWPHREGGRPHRVNGPEADNPPVLGPAGTVHAPIEDWARFIADLLRGLRGEPALLRPETYRALTTPPFENRYALGWGVAERPWAGGRALNHTGCNTLYFANAWVAPERDFAVLVCANQGEDAFPATDAAAAALIGWWTDRPAPALAPARFTVRQRTTCPLPAPDDGCRITIDDITRGQVMVSITTANGTPLIGPRSLRPGDALDLAVEGQPRRLRLVRLHNSLLGTDRAEFTLTQTGRGVLSEDDTIRRLIESLSTLPAGTRFVRNGTAHDVAEARTHLLTKWDAARDRISTAADFIRLVASGSSLSGQPYLIERPDGTRMTAGEWFAEQLRILDGTGRSR